MFSLNWLNICAMYTCNLATLFIMISSACAFHYICFVAGQHIEWSAKADYIDCSKGRNQKVRKQFTRLRTETNKLVIFIVPPLPALLIILFLFIVEKIFIKLLRAVVGVIEVFRALVLTGLAQDVLVLLGQEGQHVQERTKSWDLESRRKIILLRWGVPIISFFTSFLGKLGNSNWVFWTSKRFWLFASSSYLWSISVASCMIWSPVRPGVLSMMGIVVMRRILDGVDKCELKVLEMKENNWPVPPRQPPVLG